MMAPRCGKSMTIYETHGTVVPDKYDGVGSAIRQARQQQGLTQEQLAMAVGVSSHKVICDWETGRKYPRKGSAALEQVLGIRLDDPVCGRPAGHPGPCRSKAALARYRRVDLERWHSGGSRARQARREAA